MTFQLSDILLILCNDLADGADLMTLSQHLLSLLVLYIISSKRLLFKNIAHVGSFFQCNNLYLLGLFQSLSLSLSAIVFSEKKSFIPLILHCRKLFSISHI